MFVVNAAPVAAPAVAAAAPVVVAAAAPKSTTNPVYLIGGVAIIGLVVVIVLATVLSGPGPKIPLPLRATTAAPATAPTVTPTVAAVASPTPLVATLVPTAPAAPPPARPIVSPMPTQNPINLLEPANGAGFSGSYILLRWAWNRPLNVGEQYKVTIDCDRVNGVAPEVKYTADQQLEVPPGIYQSLTGERKCRWHVPVVASDGSPVSSASAINIFVWEKESGTPVSPLPMPR